MNNIFPPLFNSNIAEAKNIILTIFDMATNSSLVEKKFSAKDFNKITSAIRAGRQGNDLNFGRLPEDKSAIKDSIIILLSHLISKDFDSFNKAWAALCEITKKSSRRSLGDFGIFSAEATNNNKALPTLPKKHG